MSRAVVHLPQALVEHVARVLQGNLHLGQLQLDELVVRDRLAERRALAHVGGRVVHSRLGHADALGHDQAALGLEVLHQVEEALAGLPDAHVLREDDAVEVHLAEGRHLLADLVQGRRAQARGVLGDDPHGHGLVLAGGVLVLGDDQHVGEDLALGDPRLLAVEEVGAVLLLPRHAGHRLVVGACAGLGEAEGEDRLARLQVVLHGVGDLLGRRAEVDEVAHREGVVEGAERRAGMVCELLGEESQGDEVRIDPPYSSGMPIRPKPLSIQAEVSSSLILRFSYISLISSSPA